MKKWLRRREGRGYSSNAGQKDCEESRGTRVRNCTRGRANLSASEGRGCIISRAATSSQHIACEFAAHRSQTCSINVEAGVLEQPTRILKKHSPCSSGNPRETRQATVTLRIRQTRPLHIHQCSVFQLVLSMSVVALIPKWTNSSSLEVEAKLRFYLRPPEWVTPQVLRSQTLPPRRAFFKIFLRLRVSGVPNDVGEI